jgi:hypothetical protein
MPKMEATAQTDDLTDQGRWTYETKDPMSVLVDKLLGLDRQTLDGHDGTWIKAADLDAVVNASIATPTEDA